MPRRNLSVLSSGEDPYTLDRFPRAFAVAIGKQTYNARQLAKAAKVKGQYLNMYRQPIPGNKVREILALTGQRPRANTGQLIPASQLAKLRKLAKRELLARRGKRVVGPMSYDPRARQLGRLSHRASSSDDDYSNSDDWSVASLERELELFASRKFRELDARGVFRGYDEDQRDGAKFGLVHHFFFTLGHLRALAGRFNELVLPRIQILPAHAQEVARRFAAMTPGALDALTRVAPPRRSARTSRR